MSSRRVAAIAAAPCEEAPPAPAAAARSPSAAVRAHAALARRALPFGVGALLACAFAPLEWWPLAILCPAVLMWLWEEAPPRDAAWTGFWFSFGTFLAGTTVRASRPRSIARMIRDMTPPAPAMHLW